MSNLCSNFHIPASNTVGGDAETRTVLQCDTCFLYAHVQCISELCYKFQVPALNTLGVAETKTVLQCG